MKHSLLVADNDLRGSDSQQTPQTVVAIDHPPVQVVEIAGSESAAVQLDHGSQFRRQNRDYSEDHPFRLATRLVERVQHLESLRELLTLRLAGSLPHLLPKLLRLRLDVDQGQHPPDRLGADAVLERVRPMLLLELHDPLLGQQLSTVQGRISRIDDHVMLEVENPLEILERQSDERADPARERLQEPDVCNGRGQGDVPHAFTPRLGLNHLDAALLADDAAVLHPLVLPAVALVVFDRAEDLGAEQPVPLRLEGPVVDRLGLLDLTVRPFADLLRRSDPDANRGEGERILGLLEKVVEIAHWLPLTRFLRADRR